MTLHELEAQVLKLSTAERVQLAKRIFASLGTESRAADEDPIWDLGSAPVSCNTPAGSVEHDRYLYGSEAR